MKYTILGFQQTKLIENKLTIEDAFILRVIKDMFSSATMEFKDFEGTKFMWVNYTYLLSQIPIIGSKRNLKRRIEIYGKELLILRVLKNVRNGVKGSFSYIAPTEKLDLLQDYDGMDKIALPLGQNSLTLRTESPNKDTSIKDTSIKDNIPYTEIIDYLNLKATTKYKSTGNKTKDLIKARYNEKFILEDFKQVIDNKCIEWLKTEWEKFLRPETLFSNKFEGYLNQKLINTTSEPKKQKNFGNAYD